VCVCVCVCVRACVCVRVRARACWYQSQPLHSSYRTASLSAV